MKAVKTLKEIRESAARRAKKHYYIHREEILAKQKVKYNLKRAKKLKQEQKANSGCDMEVNNE